MGTNEQAELFAVAAAVSGKDYWCLLSTAPSGSGPADLSSNSNNAAGPRLQGACRISGSRGGDGDGDGEDFQHQCQYQDAVDVPPSLRAVVIAVLFANRLTASIREASAARDTFAANGRGGGLVAGARSERQQRQQVGTGVGVGEGRPTDTRYMVSLARKFEGKDEMGGRGRGEAHCHCPKGGG